MNELDGAHEHILENGFGLNEIINRLNTSEHHFLISAGGDGSIHYLCNSLIKNEMIDRTKITIGAIGLGSSNDFLKPLQRSIHKIPLKINVNNKSQWQDAGRIIYENEHGIEQEKYFVINASFGATAKGNWNFNNPGPVLKWLKKTNTAMAITYTSISTILGFKNDICTVIYHNYEKRIPVSNINILKIPYVAGSLHYKQDLSPDDSRFGLNICTGMNRLQLLKTLAGLGKGKFDLNDKKISTYTDHFELSSENPVVFECDGETELARKVRIEIVPKALLFLAS